jgi:hypothetical protein
MTVLLVVVLVVVVVKPARRRPVLGRAQEFASASRA